MKTAPTFNVPCSLPLLNISTSQHCVHKLLELDAFWLSRHVSLPFHTLGATNYYDITANQKRPYAQLARKYNPFLQNNFASLYQNLLVTLRQYLNSDVEYMVDAALPGFHIFAGDAAFAEKDDSDIMHGSWFARRDAEGFPGNPIHVDTAHLAIGFPAQVDGTPLQTISFTLALCLPASGAGMKIWPLTTSDTLNLSDTEKLQLLRTTPYKTENYECGRLFIHSGDSYHQAHGLPVQPSDYRITLQGHAVWWQERWLCFW